MDEPRRAPGGPPVPWTPTPTPPPPTPRFAYLWKRLTRTPYGTAGLGIGATAVLLTPFSGWSPWPWLAGVAVLVMLALLRVDRLLGRWVWPLGGLVVVAGLMLSTTPWAWALAASIGVLVAGVLRLPRWRVAAVGAALCLVSGSAYALVNAQDAREAAAAQARTQAESKGLQGVPAPARLLPTLLNRLAYGDRPEAPGAVCDNLLAEPARAAFTASVAAPDCVAAVRAVTAGITDRNSYADAEAPAVEQADGLVVDACSLTWDGGAAGPQLGVLTIGPEPTGQSYVVTAFTPCP
ncbi:cytochrome d ubiquinol oxidase subunit II [Pseudonocardia hydrocarbonoxydans]|uniref:Uncharacterized protein n=1 Tax=Pseudonocardia hydrocarbonoxydans TaxID=76726 RepID=A0A4Y3WTA7_9PSEU|nr:cytochrome d ubiquinol oxidase subunit II [Pseudonocardia hydrocarbonoxydans]GEC21541.1 hypothetical protein PHY01_38240 [Pseudonocardia hydrocarbonoxydans]